jgi:hypothetical protein
LLHGASMYSRMTRAKTTTARRLKSQTGDPDLCILEVRAIRNPHIQACGLRQAPAIPSQGHLSASASARLSLAPPLRTREGASRPRSEEQPSEPCSAQRSATQPRFSTGGAITAVPGRIPTKRPRRPIASVHRYRRVLRDQPHPTCQPTQPPRSRRRPKFPKLCDLAP